MSAKRVYAKSIKTPLKACKCTEDLKPVKANCSGLNYVFLGANMKLKLAEQGNHKKCIAK
jgi:hypothetical protein